MILYYGTTFLFSIAQCVKSPHEISNARRICLNKILSDKIYDLNVNGKERNTISSLYFKILQYYSTGIPQRRMQYSNCDILILPYIDLLAYGIFDLKAFSTTSALHVGGSGAQEKIVVVPYSS